MWLKSGMVVVMYVGDHVGNAYEVKNDKVYVSGVSGDHAAWSCGAKSSCACATSGAAVLRGPQRVRLRPAPHLVPSGMVIPRRVVGVSAPAW